MAKYKNLFEIAVKMSDNLRPPERLTVSNAASQYRYVNSPGSYVGPWLNTTTPYMVEPMDVLTSRNHSKMAFVGPAQSGKTDAIIINGVSYSIKVSPMDTMVFCPTMAAARDFSMRRIDRLHRHSPLIGEQLLKGRDTDNKFDKQYITGMMLTITYPTVTELAGRPVPRILMTDFDRMDDDIGGDGNPFDLATQRTTTFGS
ncbi:phage terminase large subunit family protein, partial [Proteus mirabilis]|nr:phage terminase large subunit family protein [Proteus mirabilis]